MGDYMKKKKKSFQWQIPQLPEELEISEVFSDENYDREFYQCKIANQRELEGDFNQFTFSKVQFNDCKFENVSFARCSFEDVIIQDCTFNHCDFSNSNFSTVQFINTTCRSDDFSQSHFHCVGFNGCDMVYSNFTKCRVNGFKDMKSNFSRTFFAECSLSEIEFSQTSLQSSEFFMTSLMDLDFSTCNIDGIIVSDSREELRGIIVNEFQAIDLARMLGIVIK